MRRMLMGFCALLLCACRADVAERRAEPSYGPVAPELHAEYLFAVVPVHNPQQSYEIYGPLVDELERTVAGSTFRFEASRNYAQFEERLYGRQCDFALANPYETRNALNHGYHVIAKMGDDDRFVGLIVVRRDSEIHQIGDLKGRKMAFPAPTALAATMMPKYFLQTHGLDVDHDIESLYVGSQDSAMMNVYLGNAAAAGTYPLSWEVFQKQYPSEARELIVKWRTEPLVNNGLVARDDVPPAVARHVAESLAALNSSEAGRNLLARIPVSRFELADDARYRQIDEFLRKFRQTVHPLPGETP